MVNMNAEGSGLPHHTWTQGLEHLLSLLNMDLKVQGLMLNLLATLQTWLGCNSVNELLEMVEQLVVLGSNAGKGISNGYCPSILQLPMLSIWKPIKFAYMILCRWSSMTKW